MSGARGQGHSDLITAIIFAESPDRYFTGGRDGIVCVWDVASDREVVHRQSFRACSVRDFI